MLNDYQNETPEKSVNNYIEQNSDVTKLRGGPTTTWLKLFEKDLVEIRKHPDEVINQLLWNTSACRQIWLESMSCPKITFVLKCHSYFDRNISVFYYIFYGIYDPC